MAHDLGHRDYASESEWENWNWRSGVKLMMNGDVGGKCCNSRADIIAKPGTFAPSSTRFTGPAEYTSHHTPHRRGCARDSFQKYIDYYKYQIRYQA
ncbi:unnamed protein product [Lupinus luteus]|uniref:Uncharacterized protein n=1 Tax=Lupinus luteus TaxID=3873 RepID=A0AAV1WDL3_LUPLU